MAERIENLLEEQKRLVRAQRRLLGDVSHELRSPLARLGVALELARDCAGEKIHLSCGDGSSGGPINSLGDALSRIEIEAGHVSETIDRLLVLMESGVQEVERAPVDLAALVRARRGTGGRVPSLL
jgi:signal transduction histidine kinase